MVNKYGRANPPACFFIVTAVILVLSCYLMWNGVLEWFRAAGSPSVAETREAEAQLSATPTRVPLLSGPTRTPVPACQEFEIWSADARVRECPALQCERRVVLYYEDKVCVYGRADSSEDYPEGQEWYVIDLNPNGAFRDLAYIHDSVVRPVNPTPRPSRTFTPLPTVTITPSYTPQPTSTPDNRTPTPTQTLTPTPPVTPTIPRQQF